MKDYKNGWDGLTKASWDRMKSGPYGQDPVWATCSNGRGFDAEATLKANGLHPDKIPELLRDAGGTISNIIAKVAKVIPLKYIPTPDL